MSHFKVLAARERSATFMLTLLRVAVGFIMATHGWMKLADTADTTASFAELGLPLPGLMAYLAAIAEFFGGLALIVGVLTRVAAAGIAGVMVVAILFAHLGNGLLAQNGGWEYPLTILLVSSFFVVNGAGSLSLDYALERRRQRRAAHAASTRIESARVAQRRAAHEPA
jgi:putative oxidoreductase